MLEAYGGEKKLRAVRDITGHFRFVFYQRGGTEMRGVGTEYFQSPNRNYFEFRFPDMVMRNACDGEKAWQNQDAEPAIPIDVERFIVHTRLRTFPLFLVQDPPRWHYKGEVDLENREGIPWIEVQYSAKEKASFYLDPKTFLLWRYQGPSRAMGMKVTTVVEMEDTKDFSGVPFPTHVSFFINVNKFQERWYREIKINSGISENIFQIPR